MASSALLLHDNSLLSRLDRGLYRFESCLAILSGVGVFALIILAVISVGGRNFFSQPVSGYVDWIEQIMPLIAFMGIAYAQRDGGHIRMDMLVSALRGRMLYLFEFLTTLAILILIALLVWGTWAHFLRSFDFAAPLWSRDSSIDIALPIWPAKLLVPVAFGVLCLRLVVQLYAYGRAFMLGLSRPIAVPLVADATLQAAIEAKTFSTNSQDNKNGSD